MTDQEYPNMDAAEYAGVIAAHWEAVREGRCIRNLAKRQVTRVSFAGRSYIVKTYRRGFFRRLLGLKVRNFAKLHLLDGVTPRCICDINDGDWQVTVTCDAGGGNLFALDELNVSRDDICLFFEEAGKLLAEMHRRSVFHGDTKSPNFVVNENCTGMPRILIVDCDRIKYFRNGLPPVKQAFNLAQFIQSVRRKCPFDDAVMYLVSFLKAYGNAIDIEREELHRLFILAFDLAENNVHIEKNTSHDVLVALRNTIL